MRSLPLWFLALAVASFTMGNSASAGAKYIFALVPKDYNVFFDQAKLGCDKAVKELHGEVQCTYIGPTQHGGGEEQVQIVEDLIAKKVDGIAVSPANGPAMAAALKDAKAAGIPVITWDSDLLPENRDLRSAYIGTDNYQLGASLAQLAMKMKPKGGSICIQSGSSTATNHNERIRGIRDTLANHKSTNGIGDRLTGQNGWSEVEGCPIYTNDDFATAVQQIEDVLGKYPELDALLQTGGFAELLPDAYEHVVGKWKDKIADGRLVIANGDNLPLQMQVLRKGLATGQVGQRPFEMGYIAIKALNDIKNGKPPPSDPTYTGLDTCTPDNADTCVGQ